MSASCQISPWLISQHSGMSLHSSQKHYLELWHLAALLPSQQNLLLLHPVQLQTQRNRAASPGMHPHSHCPVVCHSANWNRCLYEPASSTSQEEEHKPVCAARVPSDSSCKTPGAIHHCLSLTLVLWAFPYTAGNWREVQVTPFISLREKWQDAAACSHQPHNHITKQLLLLCSKKQSLEAELSGLATGRGRKQEKPMPLP